MENIQIKDGQNLDFFEFFIFVFDAFHLLLNLNKDLTLYY